MCGFYWTTLYRVVKKCLLHELVQFFLNIQTLRLARKYALFLAAPGCLDSARLGESAKYGIACTPVTI